MSSEMRQKKSVLMVCLGNICRSPIAEGVFQHLVNKRGLNAIWRVDSAATAPYHIGKPPNSRALETMRKHDINYSSLNKARVVEIADFHRFDFILGMDESNVLFLRRMAPEDSTARINLLGAYDPQGERIIDDPYNVDGIEGFEKCYEISMRACSAFLEKFT